MVLSMVQLLWVIFLANNICLNGSCKTYISGIKLRNCHHLSYNYRLSSLTLSLPNATVVEFIVHCQMRLQSKFKGIVESCLFISVIRDANLCSLFQNVQGAYLYRIWACSKIMKPKRDIGGEK